jgi:hypothetical protein
LKEENDGKWYTSNFNFLPFKDYAKVDNEATDLKYVKYFTEQYTDGPKMINTRYFKETKVQG